MRFMKKKYIRCLNMCVFIIQGHIHVENMIIDKQCPPILTP